MVFKVIDGHQVSAEWDELKEQYKVIVDGKYIGVADTTKDLNTLATNYIAVNYGMGDIRKHRATADIGKSVLKVKLDAGAYEPVRAHATDAGLDLKSTRTFWLHPGHQEFVDTGVHCEIPEGYVGLLTSKSGLMKKGLTTRGTIDSSYRGSIGVVVYNHSSEGIKIEAGQKITQMVLIPIITPVVEIVDELSETERGDGGFGSTGK